MKKYYINLTEQERSQIIHSLIDKKNALMAQGRYTDAVDEVILKMMKAKKKAFIIHKQIFSGTGVAAALYNNDTDEDATEWQANYLAKAILMPNGQIKRCFYALRPVCKTKSEYVCKMAEIFEVSKQAMEIRLKDFALI